MGASLKVAVMLDRWPVDRPGGWRRAVNRPESARELAALRSCLQRGRPSGDEAGAHRTAAKLGLESTLRPVGRPKKHPAGGAAQNGF